MASLVGLRIELFGGEGINETLIGEFLSRHTSQGRLACTSCDVEPLCASLYNLPQATAPALYRGRASRAWGVESRRRLPDLSKRRTCGALPLLEGQKIMYLSTRFSSIIAFSRESSASPLASSPSTQRASSSIISNS